MSATEMGLAVKADELCPCGRPLHYDNAKIKAQVTRRVWELGSEVSVSIGGRTWRVPRHYLALHGLKGHDLPSLALKYGFTEVTKL